MTDNVNILNYVIQFLNDNGYADIAQKVQSESGNELYSKQYNEIVTLCKEKFMKYIDEIYGEEVINNKNEFIGKIYNRMFMYMLYNIFNESDKKDILKLNQIMVPPLMSSTLSGEDILGTKDQGKTSQNQNNTEGGRPEKADDEKSDKTIANKEAQK